MEKAIYQFEFSVHAKMEVSEWEREEIQKKLISNWRKMGKTMRLPHPIV